MSKNPISVLYETVGGAVGLYGDQLTNTLIVLVDAPSLRATNIQHDNGVYLVSEVKTDSTGKLMWLAAECLLTGKKVFLDRGDSIVTGLQLPIDGDGSNFANVSNKTLATTINSAVDWHETAQRDVKHMIVAVMDESASTVELVSGVAVDLAVTGVRQQLGSVLGLVSGILDKNPLKEAS